MAWEPSSKLEGISAASGLFLQIGGRFRSQRIVPPDWRTFPQPADCSSKLEGVSAASGLLLQIGGRFLLVFVW